MNAGFLGGADIGDVVLGLPAAAANQESAGFAAGIRQTAAEIRNMLQKCNARKKMKKKGEKFSGARFLC